MNEVEVKNGITYEYDAEEGVGFITGGVEIPEEKGFVGKDFNNLDDFNKVAAEVADEFNQSRFPWLLKLKYRIWPHVKRV
jgi:hypothetical protein